MATIRVPRFTIRWMESREEAIETSYRTQGPHLEAKGSPTRHEPPRTRSLGQNARWIDPRHESYRDTLLRSGWGAAHDGAGKKYN